MSYWLVQVIQPLNASTLPPPVLATLRGLLPQLGASFLQSLSSFQLLELLTQPGLPTYPPAQVDNSIKKQHAVQNLLLDIYVYFLYHINFLLAGFSASIKNFTRHQCKFNFPSSFFLSITNCLSSLSHVSMVTLSLAADHGHPVQTGADTPGPNPFSTGRSALV